MVTHDITSHSSTSKPRLPKAYIDEWFIFLRNNNSGSETVLDGASEVTPRSKFALGHAIKFLVRFGMPEDLQNIGEARTKASGGGLSSSTLLKWISSAIMLTLANT